MKSVSNLLNNIDFPKLIWLVPIILFLHEMEEWNILTWYRRHQIELPEGMTNLDVRTWLLFISLVGLIWALVSLITKNKKISAYIIIPAIFICLVNCIQHLVLVFSYQEYTPGFIFAFIIGVPIYLYIIIRALRDKLIPLWYPIVFAVIILIPSALEAARSLQGTTTSKSLESIHVFAMWLSHKLWY